MSLTSQHLPLFIPPPFSYVVVVVVVPKPAYMSLNISCYVWKPSKVCLFWENVNVAMNTRYLTKVICKGAPGLYRNKLKAVHEDSN